MAESDFPYRESGDPTSEFLRLLGRHERRLKACVLALVPHWADADDVMQETRVRLWEQFGQYDRSKDFGAWACTIAYYQVLTLREKLSRRPVPSSPAFMEAVTDQFSTSGGRTDDRVRVLVNCLQKLDEAKRRLLRLYYSSRMTMRDVAAEVGRSLDAVKHSIIRSRLTLAECIEKTLKEESEEEDQT